MNYIADIDVDILLNLDVFLIFNNFLQSCADKGGSGSEKNHNYEDEPEIWPMYQCVWNSDSLNIKKIKVTLKAHAYQQNNFRLHFVLLTYFGSIYHQLTSAESQLMLY